eukprot:GHVS01081395.1.p1 GENE.GHVS01081395.1~~GHVS01081395.1.p1  ORF type:complete len:123 (-),score=7.69 GHVS01081395.1:703-1017(-)
MVPLLYHASIVLTGGASLLSWSHRRNRRVLTQVVVQVVLITSFNNSTTTTSRTTACWDVRPLSPLVRPLVSGDNWDVSPMGLAASSTPFTSSCTSADLGALLVC